MCFSAGASFAAAAFLSIAGLCCLKKANSHRTRMFAAIPCLFAVQQLIEGSLWLSFSYDWPWIQTYAPYGYLFFAFFLWPIWIPIAMRLIEPQRSRRKHLTILSMVGILVGTYLYQYILFYGTAALPLDCHIYYQLPLTWPEHAIGTVLYLLCTIVPFFISSFPIMWLLGLLLAIAYTISYLLYYTYLVSVWCFFAALLSGLVYVALDRVQKRA